MKYTDYIKLIIKYSLDLLCTLTQRVEAAAAAGKSLQLCPTLCDPIDGSPLGSSIHGIFQAGVLEWGAIAFSKRVEEHSLKHQLFT